MDSYLCIKENMRLASLEGMELIEASGNRSEGIWLFSFGEM